MKKIILATDAWYPQVNGVVKCIEEAKKFLEENNFEVILIHPGLFYSLPLLFYPEIKISLFCYLKIQTILRKEKPDYVHIFTEGPIGLATRSICIKNNIKFTTSHHTNFHYYVEKYMNMKVDILFNSIYSYLRWFHNASNGTMVITERLKKQMEKQGFKNLCLWPLGVDTDLFKRNPTPHIKEKNLLKHPIFVYFGRIAKEKNVEEYLKLDLPGTKLIIGGGPLKKSLEKKYGNRAVFVGYKYKQELVDFLSISDVFVFPSLTDTFPLAIIEALACGLPVAAHDVMGISDLVVDGVGVLNEDLKTAALDCLAIPREKCREYALQFSWEKSADHFIHNLIEN